ncbi:hypothetical protein [Psychromonas sp. Urea-02u-13]|uniref:hypothetical protein n=1 Tax=Psychromonas sp. Urea-02u-13 TaxID=2058326 RepID=UPI000C3260A1|nr:hypothetical protein [Psychromonas sp. Urea-02u-13]PKG38329.1 hypothetical protein CXF74_14160 [Psychromonas sp. Urea-02u-13]
MKKIVTPLLAALIFIALMYYAITTNQSPAQITLLVGILLIGSSITITLIALSNKVITALTNNKTEIQELQNGFDKQNENFVLQQQHMTENAEQLKTFVNSLCDLFNKRLSEEYNSIRDTKDQIQQSLSAFDRFMLSFNEHATALVLQSSDTQINHHQAQLSQMKRLEESLSKPLGVMEKQFTAAIEMQNIQNETSNKDFNDLIKQVNTTQVESTQRHLAQIEALEAGLSIPLTAIEKQFVATVEAQDKHSATIEKMVVMLIEKINLDRAEVHQGQEKLIEITELVINESANKFSKYQEQLLEKMSESIDLLEENLDSMVSSLAKKLTENNSKHQELSITTNDLIQQQQTKLVSEIKDMSKAVKNELIANREEFSAITTKDIALMEKLLRS